jgi:signal transduction histidine kinase
MRNSADGILQYVHGTVQDITALKITEQQLQDTQDKLRELVISRESLREDERKRIAWEMHEELGQMLAAMKMSVSGMRSKLKQEQPALSEASEDILAMIDKSISSVRHMVATLRPAVLLHGVVAGLEWLVTEFNKHPGMECKLVIHMEDTYCDDEELTTLAFRVAQETLEHMMRCTDDSHVTISWTSTLSENCLTIQQERDNPDSTEILGDQSLSIFGMQERVDAFGGELQVFSMLEFGTIIEARFPRR